MPINKIFSKALNKTKKLKTNSVVYISNIYNLNMNIKITFKAISKNKFNLKITNSEIDFKTYA